MGLIGVLVIEKNLDMVSKMSAPIHVENATEELLHSLRKSHRLLKSLLKTTKSKSSLSSTSTPMETPGFTHITEDLRMISKKEIPECSKCFKKLVLKLLSQEGTSIKETLKPLLETRSVAIWMIGF